MPSALLTAPAPVVIAIDPHKASWTAVAAESACSPWPRSVSGSAVTATGNCAASPAAGHLPSGRSKALPVLVLR